jgi:flagellar secretion chaperone FliS
MFSSAPQPGSRAPMSTMYRGVSASTSVEGASPHKLVSMLYQAVAGEIAAARGAVARNDIPEKCRAIGHAVRIVDEGLLAPLDLAAGGALALNLRDLYDYIVRRLTIANLNSDDAVLADCAGLVQTLRETWDAIAPQIEAAPRAAA